MEVEEQGWLLRLKQFVDDHKGALEDPDTVLSFYARSEDDKGAMEEFIGRIDDIRGQVKIKLGEVKGSENGVLSDAAWREIQERANKILNNNKNCFRGRMSGKFYDYKSLSLRAGDRLAPDPNSGVVLEQKFTDQANKIGSRFLVEGAYSADYNWNKPYPSEPMDVLRLGLNHYRVPLPPHFAEALYKGEKNEVEVVFDGRNRDKQETDFGNISDLKKGDSVAVIIWTQNTARNGWLVDGEGYHIGHETDIFPGTILDMEQDKIKIKDGYGHIRNVVQNALSHGGDIQAVQIFKAKDK